MLSGSSANTNQGEAPDAEKQAQTRLLGNSERIQQMFGSYGIEVLENGPGIRVSSLYSTHEGKRISRTFAVVAYPDVVDQAFKVEHEAIVEGQSIGILFKKSGWVLEKQHQFFGEIATPLDHFSIDVNSGDVESIRSAIHVYTLLVRKEDSEFQYASIAEIHHPEFLSLTDLASIYGEEFNNHRSENPKISDFLDIVNTRLNAI
jgi:hypothetical protein